MVRIAEQYVAQNVVRIAEINCCDTYRRANCNAELVRIAELFMAIKLRIAEHIVEQIVVRIAAIS